MRVEVLSDHPGDMLASAVRARGEAVSAKDGVVSQVKRELGKARGEGRWLAWLRLSFALWRAKRAAARLRVRAQVPTASEEAMRAGGGAEDRVASELARTLGQEWLLFRGYHNGRGEKYGNLVEAREPMTDRGQRRRSPSQQVNEPADALTGWLARRGHPVEITRAVLLTHPKARIGSSSGATVRVETSVSGLLRLVQEARPTLTARQATAIAEVIRRDHEHNERRKAGRR